MKKIKNKLIQLKRYALFSIQYFLLEKTRGLDFSMRDLSEMKSAASGDIHGYSKTNEKHLREIFKKIDITQKDTFLDIGCGKGVVLKEAIKYPFGRVYGFDLSEKFIDIAKKNFQILHLDNKIGCSVENALDFKKYGEYNVFFLFNPFGENILKEVIDRIIEEHKNRRGKLYIIYHNPVYAEVIENKNIFVKECELFDGLKQYKTYIYRARWEE